jgi:LPPG:FO 2-phospho-L-lactate transferase
MLVSLGHESSALGVARLYAGLIDGFILDALDAGLAARVEELGVRALTTNTLMTDDASRAQLGRDVLTFGERLRRRG